MKQLFIFIVILLSIFAIYSSAEELQYGYTTEDTEVTTRNVELYKGWNLIHGFANPEWIISGDVNEEKIMAIYTMNPISKKYVRFYPDPIREEVDELSNVPEMVFWVYSEKAGRISFKTSKSDILRFEWPSGWNFIGITFDMFREKNNEKVFSWKGIKGNCILEKIYAWNPESREWMSISPETESFDFDDFVGSGMAVKLSNTCKLNKIESSITPPPPIPS